MWLKITQVLVHVSTCQGNPFWYRFFEPQPYCGQTFPTGLDLWWESTAGFWRRSPGVRSIPSPSMACRRRMPGNQGKRDHNLTMELDQGSLKDTSCPFETWLSFSIKIQGNHHLEGNVQVYNASGSLLVNLLFGDPWRLICKGSSPSKSAVTTK